MNSRIRIEPVGKMGNQMLQYMCAVNIMRMVPGVEIYGYDFPLWNLSASVPRDFSPRPLRVSGHFIDAEQIADLVRSGIAKDILLNGLGLRLQNYAPREFYENVFQNDDAAGIQGYDHNYVVINVRGSEILRDVHQDYRPMPFSYFDTVIDAAKGAQPVFLGQIGDDDYSQKLRGRYPKAIIHPSRGAIADFETLRRSHQISVSVSTFSWLAAWLSSAKIIHYPLSGMLNPLQRPDIDLTPVEDPRYRFYQFGVEKWRATPAEMDRLWQAGSHPFVSLERVQDIRSKALRSVSTLKRWKQLKVEIRARAHHYLNW